jgi:hypothetical protein
MKARSLTDFADRKGRRRRVIHAPGALESWDEVAAQLPSQKANLIEGALMQQLKKADTKRVQANWRDEKSGNTPL